MRTEADWHVVYRETLAAHRELSRAIDRLRLVATAPEGVLPAERLEGLLHHDLQELSARVKAHFLAEETDRGPERKPEVQAVLSRLREDHGPLLTRLEGLCEDPAGPEPRARLLGFLDDLAAHEAEETRILQESLLRDTGAGD